MNNFKVQMERKLKAAEYSKPFFIALFKDLINGHSYASVAEKYRITRYRVIESFVEIANSIHSEVFAGYHVPTSDIKSIRKKSHLWNKGADIWMKTASMWSGADEHRLFDPVKLTVEEIRSLNQWADAILVDDMALRKQRRKDRLKRNVALFKDIINGSTMAAVRREYDISKLMVTSVFNIITKRIQRDPVLSTIMAETEPTIWAPKDGSNYNVAWMRSYSELWIKAADNFLEGELNG